MQNCLLGCNLCQIHVDFLLKNSYKYRVKNYTLTKIVLPELNTLKGSIPFRYQTNNRTFLLVGHGKRQNKSKLDLFVFDVLIRSKKLAVGEIFSTIRRDAELVLGEEGPSVDAVAGQGPRLRHGGPLSTGRRQVVAKHPLDSVIHCVN